MSGVGRPLFTDMTALAGLKREAVAGGDDDNLREVARQFEALFTHMLMKNMRAASLSDGILDSQQSRFYRDMFDQQMSTELSDRGGLGIAELLVRQLGGARERPAPDGPLRMPERPRPAGEGGPASDTLPVGHGGDARGEARRPHGAQRRPAQPGPTEYEAGAAAAAHVEDRRRGGAIEFVRRLLPHARRAGRALGVAPQLLVAQAALESGWGRRPIRGADGRDSLNLFGIKADGRWPGQRAIVDTLEYADGVARREKAAFRAYGSLAESFDDYAKLLSGSLRYREALGTGDDVTAFAGALQRGGYATDPEYASKIARIAGGRTLRRALETLGALKNP